MADRNTIRVRTSDGSFWDIPAEKLQLAIQRGATPVATLPPSLNPQPAAPGATKRLVTQTLGAPENIDTSVKGNIAALPNLGNISTWLSALRQAASSLNPVGGMANAAGTAINRFERPGVLNKVKGAEEYIESGIPWAGPSIVRSGEQFASGDYAGGTGSAINSAVQLLMMRGMPRAAAEMVARNSPALANIMQRGLPKAAAEGPVRTAAQFISGVGENAVEQARNKFSAGVAKEAAAYKDALGERSSKFSEDLASKRAADIARSRAESGADLKARVSTSDLGGPVNQRLKATTEAVSDDVQQLDQRIREFQGKKWEQLRDMAKDATVTWPETEVNKARAMLQTPADQATFDRIIDATRRDAAAGVGRQYIDAPGGLDEVLPFDEARARYTKLGEKLQGTEGNVYRALKSVQNAADTHIESALPSGAARKFYSGLKADWHQYMSDFYDPDGPFTKIKNAPTVVDRLNLLTGKWGKEMLDAMSRYYRFGPNVGLTTRLRALNRAFENLPGSAPKEAPEPKLPPRPAEPEPRVFDPVAARRAILQGKVPPQVTPGFMWRYQLLRALQRSIESRPSIREWLSQNPR